MIRLVIYLYAFMDDAGKPGDTELICCAGYLTCGSRWNKFASRWRQLLRSYRVPVAEFSMKRYAQSRGPFKGWPEVKRQGFMNHALELIAKYLQCGFASVVREADYEAYVSDGVKKRCGSSFSAVAQLCVSLVEHYVALNAGRDIADPPQEFIEYVFERGSQSPGRAHAAFEEWWFAANKAESRDFSQEDKGSEELHAADILAYEVRKNFTDILHGKPTLRYPLRTLWFGMPHWICAPDAAELADMDRMLQQQDWTE